MTRSVSDTTHSPTPFSPFSSYSVASGATSDGTVSLPLFHVPRIFTSFTIDAPDLGAFTTVFRALNTLQPTFPVHQTHVWNAPSTSSSVMSPSEYDSETTRDSIVWSRPGPSSYAPYSSPESPLRSRSAPPSDVGSTVSDDDLGTPLQDEDNGHTSDALEEPLGQPSLGYLDEALEFLAAERARITAQRDAGRADSSTASDIVLRHPLQPRRRRRRRKNRSRQEISILRRPEKDEDERTESAVTIEETGTDRPIPVHDDNSSNDPSSSSHVKSSSDNVLVTPPAERARQRSSTAKPRLLQHSKSTPSLRFPLSLPFDARIIQQRALAHKLRLFFPKDNAALTSILNINLPQATTSADPRGPVPQSQDTLIHVFIDQCVLLFSLNSELNQVFPFVIVAQTFLSDLSSI